MQEYENQLLLFQATIRKKFGDFALIDLLSLWNQEKEKSYLSYLKKELIIDSERFERTKNKKLFILEVPKCSCCSKMNLKAKDQPYMAKFKSCYSCYISYIDGREERWNKGWRPNGG